MYTLALEDIFVGAARIAAALSGMATAFAFLENMDLKEMLREEDVR